MLINSSSNLYNWQEQEGTATFTGESVIQASGSTRLRRLAGAASFQGETVISADGHSVLDGASVFRGETVITARGNTRLPLVTPEPILTELPEGAFTKQYYTARLLDNLGTEIKFTSASIEAPRNAVGKRVSINVARKDLSLITSAKTYTFQIGTRETVTGPVSWDTIVENGALNSRSFGLAQNGNLPADSLSFGTIEPLKNRLNKYPKAQTIFYNSRKTTVEIGAGDIIRDLSGAALDNDIVAVNYLTLWKLFDELKKRIGFSQIITNIPNFELTRADFPITSSWLQSLSGIIGIFEPVIFTIGTTLYILDKTAAIPDEFTPRALANAELSNWSISIPEAQEIDGFLVSYVNDETQANYFTDRLVQTTEESGDFGSPDYTRVETETTFREWRSVDAPDQILRSEIVTVKNETYSDLVTVIGRRTENHSFDSQGRRASSTVTQLASAPDLSADGAPLLQTIREEFQNVSYTTDPRNPRRSYQSKVVTRIRGLIAIDADNQYFDPETGEDAPFKQDYMEAHKPGNLKREMTTGYGPLRTITETLLDLGNGQFQVSYSTVDHLRKTETNRSSEPKTGDASLPSAQGKQSQIIVLKDGLTLSTRPGNAIEPVSIGELPLFFGIPLVERKLANRIAQKQGGNVGVIGYSDSIDRGVFFTLFDRQGAQVGKFITMGFRADITPIGDGALIQTSIEADEI